MSTHLERNHVEHVAGNSAFDCTDIERYRKTRPPTSCHQNSGLDTFAKKQSLASSPYFVSQSADRSRPCLGLGEGSWLFKIVWKWRLPHAMRRACRKGNIISNPVVTDAKVFVTTIISTFTRKSRQNWQSVTRTTSKKWEIDLVKEIRKDVKVGDSSSNLIIEIHRIRIRCTPFSSSFWKGLRQYHELMQRIQCCIYAVIIIARIDRNEYCLFGFWLRCSRWWNKAFSEVAAGACCKRVEDISKVHSPLNNSKSSMTNHKKRSIGMLPQGSKHQDNQHKFWRILESKTSRSHCHQDQDFLPRGQKYWNRKDSAEFQDWKGYRVVRQKSRVTAGGLTRAVLTAPMRSITSITRSIDRSWSDCLEDKIVFGALAGKSWLHRVDEKFTRVTSHE